MVEDALDAGKREGRAIAPVKTGRLRSGIQTPNYLPPHIEGGKVSKPTSAYAYRQLEVIDEVPYAKYQEERFRFMQKFFRTVRGETTVKQVTGKCSMQVVVDVKNLIPGTPRAGGTRGDYVLSGVREGTLTGKPDDRITLRATPNKGLQIVRTVKLNKCIRAHHYDRKEPGFDVEIVKEIIVYPQKKEINRLIQRQLYGRVVGGRRGSARKAGRGNAVR